MSVNPGIEMEEDIQIIKEYTLLPILLDMLARDVDELTMYQHKVIYHHVIFYLKEVEKAIYTDLRALKSEMRKHGIQVLHTEMNTLGIDVEYKVRGYTHHFKILRSLVKAELMTLLMNLRRRLR